MLGGGGCALLPFGGEPPPAQAALEPAPVPPAEVDPPPAAANAAPMPPRAGSYGGLAVLTDFHGDCNAGGTGLLTLRGRELCYHDAHTGPLCGALRPDGTAELEAGRVRLVARLAGTQATGSITGGVCEYRFAYDWQAP